MIYCFSKRVVNFMYKTLLDTGIDMYELLNLIAMLCALGYSFFQLKHKKECLGKYSQSLIVWAKEKKVFRKILTPSLFGIIEILIVFTAQYILPPGKDFGNMIGTGTNFFAGVFLFPLFLAIICIILKINILKQSDIAAPAYALGLFIAKIGCFCCGCCHGIECSFGMYNYETNTVEFPVQLVESGVALAIFIFLMFYKKNAKEGTVYPVFVILYSATRFFSEFLRHEPNVVFDILKTYHILCIIGIIYGTVELIIVLKYADKIKQFFIQTDFIFSIKFYLEQIKNKKSKNKKKIKHKK